MKDPTTLDAGRLRQRVTLMSPTPPESATPSPLGEDANAGYPEAVLPAEVIGLGGDEPYWARQVQSTNTHRVTIRYRDGVTSAKWFIFDGIRLDIVNATDPHALRIKLICECKAAGQA